MVGFLRRAAGGGQASWARAEEEEREQTGSGQRAKLCSNVSGLQVSSEEIALEVQLETTTIESLERRRERERERKKIVQEKGDFLSSISGRLFFLFSLFAFCF